MFYLFQESRGLILVKTLTLLLIATYTDSMFPSVCVEAVEKLGNLLKKLNSNGINNLSAVLNKVSSW
jgi:profilin